MPNSVFIRGLWGNSAGSDSRLQCKIRTEMRHAVSGNHRIPCVTYCFGRENSAFLDSIGVSHTLLDPHGSISWGDEPGVRLAQAGETADPVLTVESAPKDYKAIRTANREAWNIERDRIEFERSHWRHKLEIIRAALQEFSEVVWLDLDAHQIRPLPSSFWSRMAEGQPIQCQLVYRRHARVLHRNRDFRIVPAGSFIYVRDIDLIDHGIRTHSRFYRLESDEVALAHAIDDLSPWNGVSAYHRLGFSPHCYLAFRALFSPPVHDIVFASLLSSSKRATIAGRSTGIPIFSGNRAPEIPTKLIQRNSRKWPLSENIIRIRGQQYLEKQVPKPRANPHSTAK